MLFENGGFTAVTHQPAGATVSAKGCYNETDSENIERGSRL